jgi:hypothetical protein
MPTDNRQRLLIIVTIAAAIGIWAGDKFVLTKLTDAWSARANRIVTLRNEVARNKALVARERSIRNHWADWQARTMTNDISMAEQQVNQAIDRWAQETGVAIAAVTPQWKTESDDFQTYECRIDAASDIRRLMQFLYRVEREPMALKIESVELAARDKEGQQLSLGLQFSALVLNPPSPTQSSR